MYIKWSGPSTMCPEHASGPIFRNFSVCVCVVCRLFSSLCYGYASAIIPPPTLSAFMHIQ